MARAGISISVALSMVLSSPGLFSYQALAQVMTGPVKVGPISGSGAAGAPLGTGTDIAPSRLQVGSTLRLGDTLPAVMQLKVHPSLALTQPSAASTVGPAAPIRMIHKRRNSRLRRLRSRYANACARKTVSWAVRCNRPRPPT